jgi:hypothetical protein
MTKKKEVTKPKVAICTHVFNHVSFDIYFNHLWCVNKWSRDYDLIFVGKSGLDAARSREGIIDTCLQHGVSHAFFMDGDHYFSSDALDLLWQSKDKAMVSGLVCKRGEEFQQVGWIRAKDEAIDSNMYHPLTLPLDGQTYEVDVCAFGATLLNLTLLQKLERPYFRDTTSADGTGQRSDINLCKAFRKIGEVIGIDTRVLIGHEGIPRIVYPQNSSCIHDLTRIEMEARLLKEGQQGSWYNPNV